MIRWLMNLPRVTFYGLILMGVALGLMAHLFGRFHNCDLSRTADYSTEQCLSGGACPDDYNVFPRRPRP
jgi:hypothetical protein